MTFPMFDLQVIFFCTRCFQCWLVKSYYSGNNTKYERINFKEKFARDYGKQEVQFPKAYIKLKRIDILFSTLLSYAGKIQDGLYCETGETKPQKGYIRC